MNETSSMKRVVALGFFDGVHLGHQALMKKTVERAAETGARPAVISFDAHPDTLVRGEEVPLLGSVADRRGLISRIGGIDDIIMLHFDRRFMQMPWEAFLRSVKDDLRAVHLVMGRDFSCGWRGEGTSDKIADWCEKNGLGCDIVEKVVVDGVVVSSTYIRKLVAAGDMERAALYLGHPHTLTDTVGYGYKIGRSIGAPTINTRIPEGVLEPRHGVYATRVWLAEGPKAAVTNVGVRPTFDSDGHVTVESNILDFDGCLYGSQVRLEFLKFLREETRFSTPEALGEQIQRDIRETQAYFARMAAEAP
ncbi:MAG: riboflavin biosynthesis protein RibF [Oscillospiraceae bacterium]|nr:riboflavin biosynthesis protein RibF [Oscillospiraceae bacterium]